MSTTKGPWEARRFEADDSGDWTVRDADGYYVATCHGCPGRDQHGGEADQADNARLIAAAPDMREALRVIRQTLNLDAVLDRKLLRRLRLAGL